MSLYEDITQAFREWVRLELGFTEVEASTKVIPAERGALKGSRPPLPFLEVSLLQPGRPIGTDESRVTAAGRLKRGTREGSVRVTGYGEETSDWIEVLTMTDHQRSSPLSIVQMSPMFDTSQMHETSIEPRFVKDFYIAYAIMPITPEAVGVVERIIAPITTDDGLSETVDVDWS